VSKISCTINWSAGVVVRKGFRFLAVWANPNLKVPDTAGAEFQALRKLK